MTKIAQNKSVRRFRCKIGDSYAALDFELHDKGVLVPCESIASAHVFKRNVDASYAVQRTYQLQDSIRKSMFPTWKKFAPLNYPCAPMIEEFAVLEDDE